jgi:hypothetical protein
LAAICDTQLTGECLAFCSFAGGIQFFPGKVTAKFAKDVYSILYDDGDSEKSVIRSLILCQFEGPEHMPPTVTEHVEQSDTAAVEPAAAAAAAAADDDDDDDVAAAADAAATAAAAATSTADHSTASEAQHYEGYSYYLDEGSGAAYYINDTTGESTWATDMPSSTAAFVAGEQQQSAHLDAPAHADDVGTPSTAHPGWTRYFDTAHQHAYFVNDTTGESKWNEEMEQGGSDAQEGMYDRALQAAAEAEQAEQRTIAASDVGAAAAAASARGTGRRHNRRMSNIEELCKENGACAPHCNSCPPPHHGSFPLTCADPLSPLPSRRVQLCLFPPTLSAR